MNAIWQSLADGLPIKKKIIKNCQAGMSKPEESVDASSAAVNLISSCRFDFSTAFEEQDAASAILPVLTYNEEV